MDILTLEAATNRMWPAEEQIDYDGWLMQFAGGYTRRPNSVSVLGASTLPLGDKIAHCADAYHQRNLLPVFKMIPALGHTDVDNALAAEGWLREEDNLVMVQHTLPPQSEATGITSYYDTFQEAWLAAYARMRGLTPELTESHRGILHRIKGRTCYVWLQRDNQIVAVGLGVVEGELCGVFDVFTDARYRGQGLARHMMTQLLGVAQAWGAKQALLQVSGGNNAAIRLYHGLGFQPAYTYFYYTKPDK